MSDFFSLLDEYIGDAESVADIRAIVRRCWFYNFDGFPLRVWQGQGKLFTTDGNYWMGSVDQNGSDVIKTPSINDGRDGNSATYTFTLKIPDMSGQSPLTIYEALKTEQWRVFQRPITSYLALFKPDEGLRPETPIIFFKELTMLATKFSEKVEIMPGGTMVKRYLITVTAKDGNAGRSNVPGGTYADAIQKERARQYGVALDRGSEYLALLANRTYQLT